MAHRPIDLAGQRFGMLQVLRREGVIGQHAAWLCACDCGGTAVRSGAELRIGRTHSCGCQRTARVTTAALLARCEPDPHSDCLIWQGATTGKGAPLVRVNHRPVPVRRLLLELSDGAKLPASKCAVTRKGCHPLCCRPAHLVGATRAQLAERAPKPAVKRAPVAAAASSIFTLAQTLR